MSYCPDCCSDEVDTIKKGNKRYYVCEICGTEWSEEDNYGLKECAGHLEAEKHQQQYLKVHAEH